MQRHLVRGSGTARLGHGGGAGCRRPPIRASSAPSACGRSSGSAIRPSRPTASSPWFRSPPTTSRRTRASRTCGWYRWPVARARQLTSDKASDTQATVSPDGKWVAFVSKRGDDTENQIYVIAIDGGEARRVTNLPTGASLPKWFPDSKRIAFVSEVWPDLVRWEDQARAQEGTRVVEDDRARLDARADLALRSLPRRPAAASVLDLHRWRRAHRDHAHVGITGCRSGDLDASDLRHLARRSGGGLCRQRRSQRHRPQLRHHSAAHLRLQTGAQHHRRRTRPTTAQPRLQSRRPQPRVRAASHEEVLRRSRTPDDLRPQGRHHHRDSPRTGTGRWTGWSGSRIHAACWAPSTTPARAASTVSGAGRRAPGRDRRRRRSARWRCRATARPRWRSGRASSSRRRW